ncbi:TIGR02646 family protein [Shewanella algae]|uniref:retron Ec78 anti-phage system effector HNH endonuclease PtuB n=1 Tax=Shewanella algae TaxID=38313 RepID=UPI001AAEBB3B|nr:retron Ec78 anti-phage system effector HNH endonuclease PtuB [Shewanella algae]MBO2630870.1 TIGR02646 family protein [Shewanella algae]
MRKVSKTQGENALTRFRNSFPTGTWNDFRASNSGRDYKEIKKLIFDDQLEICAYCEVECSIQGNNRRVEHFKSKSGCDVNVDNWNLDWNNLIGVCFGGQERKNKEFYDLPENLSCDAHKEYYENQNKITDKDWTGKILYPLNDPIDNRFFELNIGNGKLAPNESFCSKINIDGNKHDTTTKLVENTISVLNLNCDRLCDARKVFCNQLQATINKAKKSNDIQIVRNLVIRWSKGKVDYFQTTRDILIRQNVITSKIVIQV